MILSIYFFIKICILKSLEIRNDVWIGTNSIILSEAYLRKNFVIGAGSVVSKYIDGNLVVAGNPVKVITKLTEREVIR
jgi:acetyltransferase-like isoleucine patch superfamily enzyme